MKNRGATLPYSVLQALIWGEYGFLMSYSNPWLTERVGLTDSVAGVVLAIATAVAFLLQPLITAVADRTRVDLRRVLLVFGVCNAGFAVLAPLLSGYGSVVAFTAACVSLQVFPSFSNALGMQCIRGGTPINFGLARGIGSIFFGICCRVEPLLTSAFGMDAVPVSSAVLAALFCAAILRFPKGTRLGAEQAGRPDGAGAFFRLHRSFAILLVGVILLYIGHNVLSNCMFRIAQFKLPAASADEASAVQGTALMIAALCELPVMFLFTRLVRRVRCDVWLVVSALFMTLRLIFTLVLPGAWGLYLGQLTQSMGFALFAVSTVYYVGSVIEQRNVVKGQTYLGAANTMGNLLAYLIGGILIDGIGTGGMLLTCGIVSALGVLLLILSKERVQQTVGA